MTFSGKDTAVINLQIPGRCELTFSLLFFSILWLPTISCAQSDTAEIRTSEANSLQNQEFDERQAQAVVQWVQQNDPQLWKILVDWEKTTADYKRLSGEHRRFVYDSVFQIEKRSDGKFYYEAPDKGRIDIKRVEVPEGAKSQKLNPQGKPYSLKSDVPEIWICDGQQIAQADCVQKVYRLYPIPKQNQGVNIMDGPLPFLFGLPARQAVQRYQFTILPQTNAQVVWLKVLPKREQDQRNWKQAQVMLDRRTYLPIAVKLLDPAGTNETVYSFRELKVNQNVVIRIIFNDADPFNIPKVLKGYKLVQNNIVREENSTDPPGRAPLRRIEQKTQPGPQPKVTEGNQPAQKSYMPKVVNYDWKSAKEAFEKRGYVVESFSAGPAPTPEHVHKLAGAKPEAGVLLQPGQKVIFYVYEEVKSAGKP